MINFCFLFNFIEFDNAEESFEQMREMEPYCIDGLDIYSNILYVRGNTAKLSYLAHFVSTIDKYRPETCFIVGMLKNKKIVQMNLKH